MLQLSKIAKKQKIDTDIGVISNYGVTMSITIAIENRHTWGMVLIGVTIIARVIEILKFPMQLKVI